MRGLERVRCWNTVKETKRNYWFLSLSPAGHDLTDVVEKTGASRRRLCAAALHVDEVKSRADNVNIWQWNSALWRCASLFFELFDATRKWRQEEEDEIEGYVGCHTCVSLKRRKWSSVNKGAARRNESSSNNTIDSFSILCFILHVSVVFYSLGNGTIILDDKNWGGGGNDWYLRENATSIDD